jgi:hypothetical protein
MNTKPAWPEPTRELAPPGRRSGEGSGTLWQYLARDELQKTSNRGAGQREAPGPQQAGHPKRRSTDRP